MKIQGKGQAEPLSKRNLKALEAILTDPYRLILIFSWYTAERPGAILKLKQDCVWNEKQQIRREILFPASIRKDKKIRLCPVHKNLHKALEQYDRPDSVWVFPSQRDPDKPFNFSTYSKVLMEAYETLNMEGYTPYSARRGALTLLVKSGVHLRHIQAISGHASLSSLQRYLEVSPEEIKAGIDLL